MAWNKYSARKTERDGVLFDSKAESRRYVELNLLLMAGEISDLELQPEYELQPSFKRGKKTIRAITYTPDFRYVEHGVVVCEDVKGVATEAFKIKSKLFLFKYPDVELRIIAA